MRTGVGWLRLAHQSSDGLVTVGLKTARPPDMAILGF